MTRPAIRALGLGLGILLVVELGLRVTGRGPWKPFTTFVDAPRISDPDPELGWVNRPGRYDYPIGPSTVAVSIDESGHRGASGFGPVGLFGGSFVFGFGLGDSEVVAEKLHAQNHGVPGYGTLQSLRAYQRLESPPSTVVYGLVGLHDGRNAGLWSWTRALERASRTGDDWGAVPTAWWDGQALVYGEPTPYRHWEASEHIALIDLLERARNAIRDRFWRTKSETTVRLVERFRDDVHAKNGRFIVALLDAPERATFYLERFEALDIEAIDLRHPKLHAWTVPGDGHPDARIHAYWADALRPLLAGSPR